jgi:hypothetical protein
MDAKATVKVGPFARGGKSRVPTVAADHDFHPEATVTLVGIFLPTLDPTLTPARYIMAVNLYNSSGCLIIRREACM